MAITFQPARWSILICDFDTGFKEPEMVKRLLVIVVSEVTKGREGLCTVVPLSATEPEVLRPFHHQMNPYSLPDSYRNKIMWAKCDMLYAVGLHRLDRVRLGKKKGTSERIYYNGLAILEDIQGVKKGILHGLRMDTLTQYI